MTFEIMAYVMAVAGGILGLRFVFAGTSILNEWGIDVTPGALLVFRRLGAMYLGLALAFFLGRGAAPSELRSALCIGVGSAVALLGALGLYELRAGRARARILVSVAIEGLLAASFAWVEWRGR